MGFLDFFFRPPSIERFAEQFMAELRKVGVQGPMAYDKANERIVIGGPKGANTIYLGAFYREHIRLPRRDRKKHLEQRARTMLVDENLIPEDLDEAREHLRPKIWVRAALEKAQLQVRLDGGDTTRFNIPEFEIGSHLVASLVYDLPDKMVSVSQDQLQRWGLTYYEAIEIACENLEQAGSTFAQIGDGFYAATTGDNYDACRLLLPGLIDRFEVQGELIAMTPNRDSLLITGADDDQGLELMLELTEKALEEPRPMAPIPLHRVDDDWVDWQPSDGHPLADRFRELRLRFLSQEYAEQRELLVALYEKQNTPRVIAPFKVAKHPDRGLFSYCVWIADVPMLLPTTDWIYFTRGDSSEILASARWHRVAQQLGQLLQPTELYPELHYVDSFPTDEQLKQLSHRRG
ncbi:MAG TPA: DUF1444 family protein [Pirellulaceae bacterium]|nr:DUF1444 family protein [Pirellulaceae bacterium]